MEKQSTMQSNESNNEWSVGQMDNPQQRRWAIRPTHPGDADYITEQWNHYFGLSCSGIPPVVEAGCDPDCKDHEYNRCFVAIGDSGRIGAAVTSVGPLEHISQCIPVDECFEYWESEDNGYIHLIFVEPEWRDKGVATELLEYCHIWFREIEASAVFTLSWRREDSVDSTQLFESADYDQLEYVENYYGNQGRRNNCPDCKGECKCDAAVYGRWFQ